MTYAERKVAGICVVRDCREPCTETTVKCQTHREREIMYGRRRWRTPSSRRVILKTKRRRRAKMVEAGKCVGCGSTELVTETLCQYHRDWHNRYDRKRRPVVSTRKCSICRELGHNRRVCPQRFGVLSVDDYATAQPNGGWANE